LVALERVSLRRPADLVVTPRSLKHIRRACICSRARRELNDRLFIDKGEVTSLKFLHYLLHKDELLGPLRRVKDIVMTLEIIHDTEALRN
jgi:hypothetical protein